MFRRALLLVFLVGCGLRLWALDYEAHGIYHPDEIPILSRALALAKGDPNPRNFLYPSLYFYMLFAWEVLFFAAGWLVGLFASLADFQAQYFRDPSLVVIAARAMTVACGVATLPAVYWLGRRLFTPAAGVVAALFLAVSPIAMRDAHYIKLDVPVTMFTAIALIALARVVVDTRAARPACLDHRGIHGRAGDVHAVLRHLPGARRSPSPPWPTCAAPDAGRHRRACWRGPRRERRPDSWPAHRSFSSSSRRPCETSPVFVKWTSIGRLPVEAVRLRPCRPISRCWQLTRWGGRWLLRRWPAR